MSDKPKSFDSVIDMLTHDCHRYAAENARLKAEVERLKQEKNELAVMIHPVALKAWMNLNAAKEGKPSV